MDGFKKWLIKGMATQIDIGRTLKMPQRTERFPNYDLQLFRESKDTNDDIHAIYSDIACVGNDMKIVVDKFGAKYGKEEEKRLSRK